MVDTKEHREVWALLPWYLNNTLSSQEQAQVEAHLNVCEQCRAELAREESLSIVVQQQPQGEWRPTLAKFDQLMAQIEEKIEEKKEAPVKALTLMARLKGWFADLGDSAPSVRWTMAAQGAFVVVLAVTLVVVKVESPDEQLYQTFSTPETAVQGAAQIRLVVDEQITERELRELLFTIEATIVQGPSQMGVYTLALKEPGDVNQALQTLRSNSRVRLAEPVGGQL